MKCLYLSRLKLFAITTSAFSQSFEIRGVLPDEGFDHSGTARWGSLPLKVNDFNG